ncbi:MAG TPA: hypothetical protein DHV62_09625 [Elusimicrobia bacterium]|nr:hypothetical protein [Elusimicrobiota bacterium]
MNFAYCKNCHELFEYTMTYSKKKFCCSDCQIEYNNRKIKAKYREESEKKPSYKCECGAINELNFYPKTDDAEWNAYKCPQCGKGRNTND